MEHHVGPHAEDGLVHGVAVGEVEVGPAARHHLVAGGRAREREVGAELAGRAGDEDSHQRADLSGRHHHSLARYQSTVASRASSSVRCLVHPRAVILAMSTE